MAEEVFRYLSVLVILGTLFTILIGWLANDPGLIFGAVAIAAISVSTIRIAVRFTRQAEEKS